MASFRVLSAIPCGRRIGFSHATTLWKTCAPVSPRIRPFTSDSPGVTKHYGYPEIKEMTANPSPTRVLIDVREPHEFQAGAIPTAVNIPIASSPDALLMPAHEFEDKFEFDKPKADQEVVFYCKAGIRSHAAAEVARQAGYKKVGEYQGSWMDWVKNRGTEST